LDVLKSAALVLMGIFLGALGSHLLYERGAPAASVSVTEDHDRSNRHLPEIRDGSVEKSSEQVRADQDTIVNSPGRSQQRAEGVRLPLAYREQIGDVRPRRPSFSERHARFASEMRDESWAFAMEAGIRNFLAARAPSAGIVIDSVECRSESCEVAGYLTDETDGLNSAIYSFTSEPWWDGGKAVSVREMDLENRTGFVFVTFDYEGDDFLN
jgi:hypothetical protein